MAEKALGLYDFTPESQEIFGAWDLNRKKMPGNSDNPSIVDYIKDDNFPVAVEVASTEWASFPNRSETGNDPETNPTSRFKYSRGLNKGKPQPALKLSELKRVYDDSVIYFKETTPVWK